MFKFYWVTMMAGILTLAGCSSQPEYTSPNAGRYQQQQDSTPARLPTLLETTDPAPVAEPLSRGGNRPYQVFGQHYSPIADITVFQETGIASWYGSKFHGHLTSNGETYNMFAMTAAHKTLPLPSYVKVTNLDNGQSAIVRVNDRGPFHRDRIIDLSYSAASKIGMLKQGTARVQLELIKSPAMLAQDLASANQPCYIQIFASTDNVKLNQLSAQVQQKLAVPTQIQAGDGIFRLLVGPSKDNRQARSWLAKLKADQYPGAYFFDSTVCS
ncbi:MULTISPECIES: septal ring lytic transglycosylase RlpA family protein [unclassified Arsukibacterium]|uniref:septal ring lytic transglycosylase RlpA family protein n=1 Tax=unclassified Arsukibacterium TaxID=2635278 RepID=UPI000C359471|nr:MULTISPECIES: septal ring lytic transglycosylase RlpA family protein [unclassified Arsukibacterium]MBM34507.1 septal ring lytic transglycosylase RlpA family lipoprotein [Rheinheimera sp.]|tara:strand:- start:393707 stop:394516 length:810 start_codon:yes stop_codon:yes gene_type:complete